MDAAGARAALRRAAADGRVTRALAETAGPLDERGSAPAADAVEYGTFPQQAAPLTAEGEAEATKRDG